MIVLVPMVAALATGLFMGCVLRATCATAVRSRSQERVWTRILRRQAEDEQRAQQAAARDTWPEPTSTRR